MGDKEPPIHAFKERIQATIKFNGGDALNIANVFTTVDGGIKTIYSITKAYTCNL